MPFTATTLGSFTTDIAVAMRDPNYVYWQKPEIHATVNECLLYWGALTTYFQERGTFPTVANQAFYDLSVEFPALRSRAYTMGNICTEMQYHLMEPPNGTGGLDMTDQFSIDQFTSAIQRNRNEFTLDSSVPLAFVTSVPALNPSGRVSLDESVSRVMRASWKVAQSGIYYTLFRDDAWGATAYKPTWNLNPGTPNKYSMAETPEIQLQLIPPASAPGELNLICTQTIEMPVDDTTPLLLPDEYVQAVKWGAMYDLLNTDQPGYDAMRAKYCLERYNQIVDTAITERCIIDAYVNNVPVTLGTLWELDTGKAFWQNQIGTPQRISAAFDVLSMWKVPNGVYSISADLVRSAPTVSADGDPIQVQSDVLPYLFDYCRHALSFKLGGQEFISTMPLYDNFMKGATQANKMLEQRARYLTALFDVPGRQSDMVPAA